MPRAADANRGMDSSSSSSVARKSGLLHLLFSPRAEGCPRLALELMAQERAQLHSDPEAAFCESQPGDLLGDFSRRAEASHFLHWRRRRYFEFFRKFRRLLRERKPTGIVCYTVGLHVPAALAAWLEGIPIVLHIGNTPPADPVARRKICIQMLVARPFVTGYAACSTAVANASITSYYLPAKKVFVVYNGIDLGRFLEVRVSRQRRAPQGKIYIGMVASLEPHKNHALLLRGFQRIARDADEYRLELVGSGTLREELERTAGELGLESKVRFLGSTRDVANVLSTFDAFAFCTTRSEGMGIAVVEALAAGLPVIASDVGGVREVLEDGRWGLLVGDEPEAWGIALRKFRDAPVPPAESLQRFDIAETFRSYWRILGGGR